RCTAAGARSLAYARRVGAWAAGRFVLAAILGGVALASCGGAKGGNGAAGPPPSGPVGPAPAFPKVGGRTLAELRQGFGPGPRLASSVSELEPGHDRIAFALFDRTRRQIGDLPVALYVATTDGRDVRGPFHADYHSLEVSSRYRSQTVARDPDAAETIYVAHAHDRVGPRPAQPDRHALAARLDARRRPRRRRRAPPRDAAVRHARALPQPNLRSGGRRALRAEGKAGARRRLHPHGDLPQQRP